MAAALILVTLMLLRADPYTLIFSWMSAFGTIGIVGLQVLVSLALIVFFRRTGLDRRAWQTLIATRSFPCNHASYCWLRPMAQTERSRVVN